MAAAIYLADRQPGRFAVRHQETERRDRPADAHVSVLVVEDNPSVRALLAHALTGSGRDVYQAADVAEAEAVAAHVHPDVIIADVFMPGRSGIEMRRDFARSFPTVPFILISGYSPDQVAEFAARTPATEFLPKPFAINRLLELVARAAHPGSGDGANPSPDPR